MFEWLDWFIMWSLRIWYLTGFAVIVLILVDLITAILTGKITAIFDRNGKQYIYRNWGEKS